MDVVGVCVFYDVFGNVVGGVYGYYFVGIDDVDFLSFVFVDWYGEVIVNYVIEYVVEYEVEFVVVGVFFFKEVDGGDDVVVGIVDIGFWVIGFDVFDVVEIDGEYVFEFEVFYGVSFGS